MFLTFIEDIIFVLALVEILNDDVCGFDRSPQSARRDKMYLFIF